jgi:transcriptional regulator
LLKPAIHIYRKIGFKELSEYHPAYERGDIQMELTI